MATYAREGASDGSTRWGRLTFLNIIAIALVATTVAGVRVSTLLALGQRPEFRVGVDLVSLSVTVQDPVNRYVPDLDRGSFEVIENGVPQNLTFFAKADVPVTLALLLDTSASMQDTLPTAQEAAIGFARQLAPTDMATVIDFDSRVETLQGFTNEVAALETAIRRTTAGGSTALYNAVYIALKELNRRKRADEQQMVRRTAIILLSDGEDTSSLVTFEAVLDLASRSNATIYAIGLGRADTAARLETHNAQFVLRRLAQTTGGRAFFPLTANELTAIYRDIRDELSNQYALAYESSSPRRDGQWRSVSVRVNRPNVMVRTRQGYYAPAR